MTITNLTAKENNGVVVAEFEAEGCSVWFQMSKAFIEKFIKDNVSDFLNFEHVAEYDLYWIIAHKIINFNLQEAE